MTESALDPHEIDQESATLGIDEVEWRSELKLWLGTDSVGPLSVVQR